MLQVSCPDVVVADGDNSSQAVSARHVYEDSDYITLFAAASALADGVIETSPDYDPNDSTVVPTWYAAVDDTETAITPPDAGKSKRISTSHLGQAFRITSAVGASGADATWHMTKRMISVGA